MSVTESVLTTPIAGRLSTQTGGSFWFDPEAGRTVIPVTAYPGELALGPLTLATDADAQVNISSVGFWPGEPSWFDRLQKRLSSLFAFTGAGALAAAPAGRPASDDGDDDGGVVDDHRISRRDVLLGTAVLAGPGVLAADAQAASPETLSFVELEIESNPAGITVGILDAVDNVLPTGSEYFVGTEDASLASFTGSGAVTIPAGKTGTFQISTEADTAWTAQLRALFADDTATHKLTLDKPLSKHDSGTDVVLSTSASVVDAVNAAGSDDTIVTAGNGDDALSIPAAGESKEYAVGYWRTKNGKLLYRVGGSAPEATTVVVKTAVSSWAEAKDDAARVIQKW